MQIFLWTEDAEEKAGYIFWKTLMDTLFPEIIVESKQNCSELLKAITNISDDENKYIIAMDHSFDNDQVMREIIRLKKICAKRKNVYELNIISFEYILLEFKYLIEWIYAEEDDFREKRKHIINVRSKLISAISCKEDYKTIDEIQDLKLIKNL